MTEQYLPKNINQIGGSSDFVVGPSGSGAPYTSIQDAIDAAAAQNPSVTGGNPILITVLPGFYVEDITARPSVGVASQVPLATQVSGTITVDLNAPAPGDNGTLFENIGFEAPPGQNTVVFTGSADQNLVMFNCEIRSSNAESVIVNNTGASSGIQFRECDIISSDVQPCILQTNGFIDLFSCSLQNNTSGPAIDAFGQLNISRCQIDGQVLINDNFVSMTDTRIRGSALSALFINNAAAGAFVESCSFESFAPFFVEGSGFLSYSPIVAVGSSEFDPALTLNPFGLEGASGFNYEPDPANWSGPAPQQLQEAVNRMANLLVVLNGGTIP